MATTRERRQLAFLDEATAAMLKFLNFHPTHAATADRLVRAVLGRGGDIGAKSVLRRHSKPLSDRVSNAVYAWLRHQTTGYDAMAVGYRKRAIARQAMNAQSTGLLNRYRNGLPVTEDCPLQYALDH